MRLVYLGSPDAAVPPLRALVEAGHEVLLVVSQPDRKRGRGSALVPSPVKTAALELGLPVTDRVDEVLDAVAAGAELGVVVAYGRLIKPHLLAAVPFVNLHFSLLPRWRGAAPVERAILAGDTETGVCLMALEEGLDTGPVFDRVTTPIGENESASDLRARLVTMASEMLIANLAKGVPDLARAVAQTGEPTYARKLEPSDFAIDWTASAADVARVVRIGNAWTTFRGARVKVHEVRVVDRAGRAPLTVGEIDGLVVSCGSGAVELVRVQPEGKAAMDASAWRNGTQPKPGERFITQDRAPEKTQ